MEKLASTLRRLDRRAPRVMGELHPELHARVSAVLDELGGRFTPWEGFRGQAKQNQAKRDGWSNARWLQSPHNYTPALAVDVVLDPRRVPVAPHPKDPRYPYLWDNETHQARVAWMALEKAAIRHHLTRVSLKDGRDLPHLELPGWRSYVVKGP